MATKRKRLGSLQDEELLNEWARLKAEGFTFVKTSVIEEMEGELRLRGLEFVLGNAYKNKNRFIQL